MLKLKKIIFRGPKYIGYLICLLFFYFIGIFAKTFSSKYRNVWIVSERGIDARDNGYHFYKYLRTLHPEINSYYIIDKKSVDRAKILKYGNIVNYRSFKHHLLFAVSTHKISTHIFGYAPDILCYNRFQKLGLIRGKIAFLQHGIIKDDITWMFYPHAVMDLFVCGAKKEYEAVKSRYGYPDGVVKYLGLCRYDALLSPHEEKRQILLMPSWRVNFYDMNNADDFKKTDYYIEFQNFINNKDLIEFLEKQNYELVFFPHIEVQKFLHTFSSSSKNVILASFKEYDVQKLLMTSKLLITDFSSVFFDFAYMDKPVVYFQFDEDKYRKSNYAEGYFSYRNNGFGPVLCSGDDVVKYIIKLTNNGFKHEKEYAERVSEFFEVKDTNNCERNYNAVKAL